MKNTDTIQIGDKVRVPNGETGIVSDAFRKDGEDHIVVTFPDGTWITTTADDVEKVR